MFILIWIKFNQYPFRTRLLAGLSVAFILIFIIGIILFCRYCFNDLARYTSKNTKIYFQADLRHGSDNFYKIKLIDSILNQYGLEDIDRHLINSRLAIICDESANNLNCGLLIKSDNKSEIARYLKAKQAGFRELKSGAVIISDDDYWLNSVKKSHNPLIYFKYQSTLYRNSSLTLVINQPTILNNGISKGLYFSNLSKSAKFKGEITTAGLIILPKKLNNAFFSSKNEISMSRSLDCDIYVSSENGVGQKLALLMPILSQPYDICLNKTNSTGNIYNDYEFTIISDQLPDSAEKIAQLENKLLDLASLIQPKQKVYYLKDGTKILEFVSNNNNLSFISTTSTRSIPLLGDRNLHYYESMGKLIISNQEICSIKMNFPESDANYAIIRISALPAGQIQNILSGFSYLILNKDKIMIK